MEAKEKTNNLVGRIPLSLWTRSPEVDPEIQTRDWRYSWERPWRDGLKVKGKPARTDSGGTPFEGSSAPKQGV